LIANYYNINYGIAQDTDEICIKKLLQREHKKPMRFHPVLQKNFDNMELKLLFKGDEKYYEAIEPLCQFIRDKHISTKKEILKLIRFIVPSYATGLYDCENNVELTINSENETIDIQKYNFDSEPFTIEHLTKEEYLLLIQNS